MISNCLSLQIWLLPSILLTEFHSLLPVRRKPFRPSPFKTELLLFLFLTKVCSNSNFISFLIFGCVFLMELTENLACWDLVNTGYTLCLEKQKVFNDDIFLLLYLVFILWYRRDNRAATPYFTRIILFLATQTMLSNFLHKDSWWGISNYSSQTEQYLHCFYNSYSVFTLA
jgi:hypothetical protein